VRTVGEVENGKIGPRLISSASFFSGLSVQEPNVGAKSSFFFTSGGFSAYRAATCPCNPFKTNVNNQALANGISRETVATRPPAPSPMAGLYLSAPQLRPSGKRLRIICPDRGPGL